jgi:hypothetical protein
MAHNSSKFFSQENIVSWLLEAWSGGLSSKVGDIDALRL